MRKIAISLLLVAAAFTPAFCQQPASARATAIPYGNNKQAGKYYDIRGFKMYCEVYHTKSLWPIAGRRVSRPTKATRLVMK